jgi:hypothetical protein
MQTSIVTFRVGERNKTQCQREVIDSLFFRHGRGWWHRPRSERDIKGQSSQVSERSESEAQTGNVTFRVGERNMTQRRT